MNPKPHLDPSHTAILVIDAQIGLFNGKPPAYDGDAVIARINEITDRARAANVPVIIFQHDGDPKGDWMVPFTDDWKLHPKLHIVPSDILLRKATCDAFYDTKLETALGPRGISTLVLTGFATDFCIDATLRIALSKEFEVVVVEDAHTTTDSPVLSAPNIRRHFNWAWPNCSSKIPVRVLPASELIFR